MDLQTLHFFCVVASEGSFSKAAQKLNYAQSNLSTKILQLEKDLQVNLLYRHNRGISLTPKGDQLLQYATDILNLTEETEKVLKDDGTAKGELTIGSMESTAISYLPELLSKYHKDNPAVALKILTGTSEYSVRKVLDHTYDGAFVAGNVSHPDLAVKCVKKEHLVLITNAVDKVSLDKDYFSKTPLLVFPHGCSYRNAMEGWLKDDDIFIEKTLEFDSLSAIISSVSAGLGVSLFPESAVKSYAASGSIACHEIPKKYADISTYFVYRKNEFLESSLQAFIQSI